MNLLNKTGTRPFILQDMLNNISKIRFTLISESRKFIGSLLPKISKFYKVKVEGINGKSFLIEVYKSELFKLHKKVSFWSWKEWYFLWSKFWC